MQIWQQGGGDGDRNTVDICLRNGVIINGPSAFGPWDYYARTTYANNGISHRKCTDIERFVSGVQDGDIVLLRQGTSQVYGVGRVIGEYEYIDAFSDIDGWDVAHVRHVDWIWTADPDPKQFETYTLNQGDTTQLLPPGPKADVVRNWVSEVLQAAPNRQPPEPRCFRQPIELSLGEACKPLFDCGLSAASVSSVTDRIADLARLADWYRSRTSSVSEAETMSQLILPLLSALGWSPQTLAVEWSLPSLGRADLAAFRPFRNQVRGNEDVVMLLEAKRFDRSCLIGVEQVRNYSSKLPNVNRLVVSDGLRYAVFVRESKGEFPELPYAYINLSAPKDHYAALDCFGADEALLALSAAWAPRLISARPDR